MSEDEVIFAKEEIRRARVTGSNLSSMFKQIQVDNANVPCGDEHHKGSNVSSSNIPLMALDNRVHLESAMSSRFKRHPAALTASGALSKGCDSGLQRARSSSFQKKKIIPICDYSSLPDSPAVNFLSSFVQDESVGKICEGDFVGPYVVGELIGRGNFSECRKVYFDASRGSLELLNEPDASKNELSRLQVLAAKIVKAPCIKFEDEIRLQRKLRHGNILPILDFLEIEGHLIAIFPWANQGALIKWLSEKALTEEDAKVIFRQLVEAVKYLHGQRIVHWDIKLDNILLHIGSSQEWKIYLSDFGLSEQFDENGAGENRAEDDALQSCKGTLIYCAPEQLDIIKKLEILEKQNLTELYLSKKADIWALGVVLYAFLTANLPFSDAFTPRIVQNITNGHYEKLDGNYSDQVRDLISKMLHLDPLQRLDVQVILDHPWLNQFGRM